MKKRQVKQVLAAMLTMSMLAGVLTGCGNTSADAENSVSADTTTVNESSDAADTTAAAESSTDANEEPTVISVLAPVDAISGDWNNYRWVEMIEEELNVDLQIETIPEDVWEEKHALYFVSDSVPDIVFGNINAALYGMQGFLLDMSEYISEEATPNIYGAFQDHPDLRRVCAELDGSIYRMYGFDGDQLQWGRHRLFVQRHWCNEILGKSQPETLEELTTYLIGVRDKDMDGDGNAANEIPIGGCYADARQINIMTIVLEAMGHVTTANLMEVGEDEKTAVFVPTCDEYKDFLKYMNMLWEEELLESGFFSQSADQKNANISNALYGSYGNWSAGGNYKMLTPLTSEYNDTPVAAAANVRTVGTVSVGATTEHPEKVMKVIDWMLNEDNFNLLNGYLEYDTDPQWPGYGHKWEYVEEKGHEAWVFYGPEGVDDYPMEHFREEEIAPYYDQVPMHNTKTNTAYPQQDGNLWYELSLNVVPYHKSVFPGVKFTTEEESERALIFADLNAYYQEMETKMITGELDIDATWDEYVQGLKDRGLDRYVEIYQNGLDAWLSN